ncbi:hypothetical protein MMS21_26095, partial [Escherichia coli]|nr:hypothetical protein [Escherichia coli]
INNNSFVLYTLNLFNYINTHKNTQQEPTVGHRANVAEWRQRRHFAAFALSCIRTLNTGISL